MNGKVIDSGANSIPLILLVLLPLALVIQVLFVAWPFIVAILILTLGYQLWQKYRLQKLSEEIDPYFNQLVKVHQGSITVLDLSNKTDLDAKTARWYLDKKAEEYGGVKREYEDKGILYYFLTASALGSILDDSEPEKNNELDIAVASKETHNPLISTTEKELTSTKEELNAITTEEVKQEEKDNSPVSASSLANVALEIIPEAIETSETENRDTNSLSEEVWENPVTVAKKPSEIPTEATTTEDDNDINSEGNNSMSLNQSDLAKRLEVHPSTVGKRKSDQDFGLWSQSRDPDGIPWQYIEDTKLFIPLE